MRLGWRLFARRLLSRRVREPDTIALDKQSLLMAAVITISSVALLGTSDDDYSSPTAAPPETSTTYSFKRANVDGGSVDLTSDEPRATYYINVQATSLGPSNVVSTTDASVTLLGTVTATGLNSAQPAPYVSFLASGSASVPVHVQASGSYLQSAPLTFDGNCADPTQGKACRAQLSLEIARSDDGASGGVLHVDWHLTVQSIGVTPSATSQMLGPLDPPWQIEVTR